MYWSSITLIALVFFSILFIGIARLILARKKNAGTGTYKMRSPLFTPAERSFLGALDQAVGSQYRVFGKVRVADVVTPNVSAGSVKWRSAFNRIAAKHFDFVVCRTNDLAVVCVIELDDRSHGSKRAMARDDLVARACNSCNLPLLRVPAKAGYNVERLRQDFLNLLTPLSASSEKKLEPADSGVKALINGGSKSNVQQQVSSELSQTSR